MSDFTLDITKFVEKAKGNVDTVIRKVAADLLTRVVQRSPVGNPELWAANQTAAHYNIEVANYNIALRADPANLNRAGRLKRGKKLKDGMQVNAPAGYVGGRFRGSWVISIGSRPTTQTERIDPSGAATIAAGMTVLAQFTAGPSIFLLNNVPYAAAIEYGHSKQAPAGVVRVTLAEFRDMIARAVGEVNQS